MRAVVWADDALRDFESALFHIAQENPVAASLVADRIEATADALAQMPIGHQGRVKGTYEKLVLKTPYIIAYALSDTVVTIVRVIHGSRDWHDDTWPG